MILKIKKEPSYGEDQKLKSFTKTVWLFGILIYKNISIPVHHPENFNYTLR